MADATIPDVLHGGKPPWVGSLDEPAPLFDRRLEGLAEHLVRLHPGPADARGAVGGGKAEDGSCA